MTDNQAITTLLDAAIEWAEWRFFSGGLEVRPEESALFDIAAGAQVERERAGSAKMTESRAAELRNAAIAWAEWRHDHGPSPVYRAEDALLRLVSDTERAPAEARESGDDR